MNHKHQHAFFKNLEAQDDFHRSIKLLKQEGDLSVNTFKKLRKSLGGTSKPKTGYHHVEAVYDTDSKVANAVKTHASAGRVVNKPLLKRLNKNTLNIYRAMKEASAQKKASEAVSGFSDSP